MFPGQGGLRGGSATQPCTEPQPAQSGGCTWLSLGHCPPACPPACRSKHAGERGCRLHSPSLKSRRTSHPRLPCPRHLSICPSHCSQHRAAVPSPLPLCGLWALDMGPQACAPSPAGLSHAEPTPVSFQNLPSAHPFLSTSWHPRVHFLSGSPEGMAFLSWSLTEPHVLQVPPQDGV